MNVNENELVLEHFTPFDKDVVTPILLDVYSEVYADVLDEPFSTLDDFTRRLDGYVAAAGWECVLGKAGDEPVGYAFGYPLPPGARWWQGLRTPVDPADIAETGARTFALNEIMVREPWRGTEVAHRIHDELMAGRTEQRATLLVEQTHPRVRARYEQWGYRWLGVLQPQLPDAPVFEALILPLRST